MVRKRWRCTEGEPSQFRAASSNLGRWHSYLCMRAGKRLEPEQFYSKFAAKNGELFDCAWGCRDYRQGAIAMARHFISADATFTALDDALAEAADHSTDVDHGHYGRTFGDHPRLTHNDMEKQRWICQEWHSFLGLGPFPVQEPIVAVRSRGGPRIDKDAVKSVLSEILPDFSSAVADAVMKKIQTLLPGNSTAIELLTASTSHPNAPSTTSRTPAAAEIDIETDFEIEIEGPVERRPSAVRGSVRKSHPGAAVAPSSSRRRQGLLPAPSRPGNHPSAGQPDVNLPSAKRRFQIELAVFSSDPPSPSTPDRGLPELKNKGKGREVAPEPVVSTQIFSDLDFSSPSPRPVPHPRPLHVTPGAVPHASGSHPIAHVGRRKRCAPEALDSELEFEEVTETPQKRLRRDAGAPSRALSELTSDDDMEDVDAGLDFDRDSMADFIAPSTPDPATESQRDAIRSAIARAVSVSDAREKSAEQMDAIMAILNGEPRDMAVVMKTGGGKSLLWTVPPLLGVKGISVVICPFKALMDEQYRRCVKAGVRCHDYGASKDVRNDVQNLFLQVEHASMDVFQRLAIPNHAPLATDVSLSLLVLPLGRKIKRVFIDEFHDIGQCHPDRRSKWDALARQCSQMDIQIILLSATCPPSMTDALLRPFKMDKRLVHFIRGPTDREEIGLHYIRALYTADNAPLHKIVGCLHAMLKPEERILVFFNSKSELVKFAKKSGCALYHSDLYEPGNTREANLRRWDSGEMKVMACTTGFAQGVDRPHVRFVVMKEPEYGLLVAMQMMGRAGRDGKKSHAFVVDANGGQIFKNRDLASSSAVKQVLGDDRTCRVLSTTKALDGGDHAYECSDRPSRTPCDLCDPRDPIHRAVLAASKEVNGPIQPLGGAAQPMRTEARNQRYSGGERSEATVRFACPVPVWRYSRRQTRQRPPISSVVASLASFADSQVQGPSTSRVRTICLACAVCLGKLTLVGNVAGKHAADALAG
jgi:superfamily II DNA or RNA helicase